VKLALTDEEIAFRDELRAWLAETLPTVPPEPPHDDDWTAKRALWGALEHGLTDACRAGAGELTGMWGHPDQAEGPAAFAEKREPEWQPLEP